MEPPGRCGDWLAPPPSPPRAHAPGRHDERGMGTSIWPPAGTYTWPSAGTFPWPWTAALGVTVRALRGTSTFLHIRRVDRRSCNAILTSLLPVVPERPPDLRKQT